MFQADRDVRRQRRSVPPRTPATTCTGSGNPSEDFLRHRTRVRLKLRRTDVTARALRYYEAQGLLPATRASNGYREYGESALRRVANIRRLLAVGFTSDEIRAFIPCLGSETALTTPCPPQASLIAAKLTALQTEIDELTGIRDRLAALLEIATDRHLSEAG